MAGSMGMAVSVGMAGSAGDEFMKASLLYGIAVAALMVLTIPAVQAARDYRKLYGDPVPPGTYVQLTMEIRPDTRYVNVQGGDTARFLVGNKSFDWTFNVAGTVSSFQLNEVSTSPRTRNTGTSPEPHLPLPCLYCRYGNSCRSS